MTKVHCDDHVDVVARAAAFGVSIRHLEDSMNRLEVSFSKIEDRFSKLEKRLYMLIGGLGLFSFIAAPLLKTIIDRLIPSANADVGGSMEVIVEPGQIDQLIGAWHLGQWGVVAGVLLVVLVTLIRGLTREKLSERADKFVSALSAVVMASAVMLVAGVDPVKAALLGLLASGGSAGLLDALRGLIPSKKGGGGGAMTVATMALVLFLPMTGGCGAETQRPHCTYERIALEAARAASNIATSSIPEDFEDREEAELYASRSLELSSAAVEACETLRDDGDWKDWLRIGIDATASLFGILVAAGVEEVEPVSALLSSLGRAVGPPGD